MIDGPLINTNDWSEEVMITNGSQEDDFVITDEIKTYIDKTREMYNATVPNPVRNFDKRVWNG